MVDPWKEVSGERFAIADGRVVYALDVERCDAWSHHGDWASRLERSPCVI